MGTDQAQGGEVVLKHHVRERVFNGMQRHACSHLARPVENKTRGDVRGQRGESHGSGIGAYDAQTFEHALEGFHNGRPVAFQCELHDRRWVLEGLALCSLVHRLLSVGTVANSSTLMSSADKATESGGVPVLQSALVRR